MKNEHYPGTPIITKTSFEKNELKYPDSWKLSEGCTSAARVAASATESEKSSQKELTHSYGVTSHCVVGEILEGFENLGFLHML